LITSCQEQWIIGSITEEHLEDTVDWSNLKRQMFKNSDNDNDTEAGHTCSGRVLREVHLANLFKKNYGDEGFYSGEEADLTNEEHSELTRERKRKSKNFVRKNLKLQELHRPLK
jgi:hypothetical protein